MVEFCSCSAVDAKENLDFIDDDGGSTRDVTDGEGHGLYGDGVGSASSVKVIIDSGACLSAQDTDAGGLSSDASAGGVAGDGYGEIEGDACAKS